MENQQGTNQTKEFQCHGIHCSKPFGIFRKKPKCNCGYGAGAGLGLGLGGRLHCLAFCTARQKFTFSTCNVTLLLFKFYLLLLYKAHLSSSTKRLVPPGAPPLRVLCWMLVAVHTPVSPLHSNFSLEGGQFI